MSLGAIPSSKILKKGVQIKPKLKRGLAPKRVCRLSWSADWPKCLAWPENFLIKIKPIFFQLFRDKDAFQFISDLT